MAVNLTRLLRKGYKGHGLGKEVKIQTKHQIKISSNRQLTISWASTLEQEFPQEKTQEFSAGVLPQGGQNT